MSFPADQGQVRKPFPEPRIGHKGGDDPGPRNLALDRQNPDALVPPSTDHGTLPNLKFSYSHAHMRLENGGWTREITARELPIATTLAGVNMRLLAGAVRELHWHRQAEWSFMLNGRARITAVDGEGRNFVDDVAAGDLWYFPAGIPHSIQALEEGCEFLLIFPDGQFSENSTFLLTDLFAHMPPDVLVKNFGVAQNALGSIPQDELYIFAANVPGPLERDRVAAPKGAVSPAMSHRLLAQTPIETTGGRVRIADSKNFPISRQVAVALVEVNPGAIREIHWHPNADEWQYYIEGKARMTVFAAEKKARTFDYQAGDVGYVPMPMAHYVENIGDTPLRFLEVFRSDHFADVSLNQWMALTPPELVQAHLNLSPEMMDALRKTKAPVVPA